MQNEYVALVRNNRNYRLLWLGAIASFLGDWLNTIALYVIVQRLTGSPLALGAVFITKMLPFAIASPLAGLLTDRFNRRRLMIATDILRALTVLGFLLVDSRDELWLLYALISLQVILSAVFITARLASIPNITTAEELPVANALSAATWSVILAIGAALGGLATDRLGTDVVFLLDSLTYCVSALFLWRTVIPQETDAMVEGATLGDALRDIVAGWRHLIENPHVGRIAFAKAAWAIGGGGLVFMLVMIGEDLFPGAPALGIGLLYSTRGVGTGVGPIVARSRIPDERRWPALLGFGVLACGVAYLVIGLLPWGWWWTAILVGLAHAPSGVNWVFSTVLLQRRTVDRFRGRVMATQWLLLTGADSLSIVAAALLLEVVGVGLRAGILIFAVLQVLCGLLWLALVVPPERRLADTAPGV
jgi:MFS family permease